jgi:riboflavin biosynthesis pyrimidine reductase
VSKVPEEAAKAALAATQAAVAAERRRVDLALEIYGRTVSAAAVTDSDSARAADARTIAAGAFRLADEFLAEQGRQADPEYRARFDQEAEVRRLGDLQYQAILVKGGREIHGQIRYPTVDQAQDAIRQTAISAATQGKVYDSARIEVHGQIEVQLPQVRVQEEIDDD